MLFENNGFLQNGTWQIPLLKWVNMIPKKDGSLQKWHTLLKKRLYRAGQSDF